MLLLTVVARVVIAIAKVVVDRNCKLCSRNVNGSDGVNGDAGKSYTAFSPSAAHCIIVVSFGVGVVAAVVINSIIFQTSKRR